jgi:hypothetical protein
MTRSFSLETSLVRNVSYGSEMVLIMGEAAEMRAFCREALSRGGYHVMEAANCSIPIRFLSISKAVPI